MDFAELASQCAPLVHQSTIAAIVKTESLFKPYAIGINKKTAKLDRQPTNKADAVATAKELIEGGHNIDMGLGQINSANLKWLGLTIEDIFDPCKNLAASQRVLLGNYQSAIKTKDAADALLASISAYNTGNYSRGFSNGYVTKVVANNQKIQDGYIIPSIKPQTSGSSPPKSLVSTGTGKPKSPNPEPVPVVPESMPAVKLKPESASTQSSSDNAVIQATMQAAMQAAIQAALEAHGIKKGADQKPIAPETVFNSNEDGGQSALVY